MNLLEFANLRHLEKKHIFKKINSFNLRNFKSSEVHNTQCCSLHLFSVVLWFFQAQLQTPLKGTPYEYLILVESKHLNNSKCGKIFLGNTKRTVQWTANWKNCFKNVVIFSEMHLLKICKIIQSINIFSIVAARAEHGNKAKLLSDIYDEVGEEAVIQFVEG